MKHNQPLSADAKVRAAEAQRYLERESMYSKKGQSFSLFNFIGMLMRLPFYLIIVALKCLILIPFEVIMRIIFSPFVIIGFVFKCIGAVFSSDKDAFRHALWDVKDYFQSIFILEFGDFSKVNNFLIHGKYQSRYR